MVDLDVAFRFRKNCERSDGILQRFLNPTEETLSDEFVEHISETSRSARLVTSDGLYEYKPPHGLNVKRMPKTRTATRKENVSIEDEHTIYLKSEPMDEETLDESSIDVLYDIEPNYEDSTDAERTSDSIRIGKSNVDTSSSNENDPKIMQIKPVRTNKVRLGHTTANKGKSSGGAATRSKTIDHASKENAAAAAAAAVARSPKSKTNAKGEPKQPKKCEICGNTYMYQHALERYLPIDDLENDYQL